MLIHLKDFGGLVPKLSDRSLPPNSAKTAQNTQLYSGEVRGLRQPLEVADLTAEVFTVLRAYRLNDGSTSIADATGDWIAFDDEEVNFIRGALKNDSFDRYYAAGGTQAPVVAEATEWAAGNTPHDLGVPAPTAPPTVTPPASGTVDETRAYVYTFVNEWGEESAPSPASTVATGDIGGTWQLTGIATTYPAGLTNPNPIDKVRIYRTVTGTNSVDYRFVAELDPPAATYNDLISSDTVSLNESLESLGWDIPPSGLQGIVNMANGIMVGFVGRDIYFSEAYRPHAWPADYIRSVENDIVGLGVYQSGVVVCTTSNPYVATGVSPASVALTRIDDVEPCQSFRSIINGLDGVSYASQNGMILVNQEGARNLTQPLITRNEWRDEYFPSDVSAAADGSRTIAFYSTSSGWMFQPMEPLGHLVDLTGFADVATVQTDQFTGETYIISRDVVYLWNPIATAPQSYVWESKQFELPYPVNMGAYRLQYEDVITGQDYAPGYDYTNYNTSRYTATDVTAEIVDPPTIYDDVLFQADLEGTNGSTTYTEESPYARTGTFTGTATISTGSPIFNTSSLDTGGTGSGNNLTFTVADTGDRIDWDATGRCLTMEIGFSLDSIHTSGDRYLCLLASDDVPFGRFSHYITGGTHSIRYGFGTTATLQPITALTTGVDYFLIVEADYTAGAGSGVERAWLGTVSGGTCTLIGTRTGLTAPPYTQFEEPYSDIRLGALSATAFNLDGRIDHVRITNSATNRFGTGSTVAIDTAYTTTPGGGTSTIATNPLNTLNLYPINGVRTETGVTESPPVVQWTMSVGGSPLVPTEPTTIRDSIRVQIYGDDVLRYDREITSNDVMRLPSGYKADKWRVRLTTAQNIYSFKMAGTAKELAKA